MKFVKRFTVMAVAVIMAVFFVAAPASADDVRIGWGFLFPIPLPIPIYQLPHEPSPVTIGLLFPIPVPLPVYDYNYHKVREEVRPVERYGMLQTLVRPTSADVYIDGKFYGRAGDFASKSEAVTLYPGNHAVEFRTPGYKTYSLETYVGPGRLVTVEYEMQPVQ